MIKINDKKFNNGTIRFTNYEIKGTRRPALEIVINNSNYNDIAAYFVDNAPIIYSAKTLLLRNQECDYQNYQVAGDIVDHRDGSFTVYMGKKTQLEEALATNAALEAENAELLFQSLTGEVFAE